jgi:hypothetical protein
MDPADGVERRRLPHILRKEDYGSRRTISDAARW